MLGIRTQTVGDPTLQPVIMTSVLKRVDNAVDAYINDFVGGKIKGGSDITNDLKTDGVGLSGSRRQHECGVAGGRQRRVRIRAGSDQAAEHGDAAVDGRQLQRHHPLPCPRVHARVEDRPVLGDQRRFLLVLSRPELLRLDPGCIDGEDHVGIRAELLEHRDLDVDRGQPGLRELHVLEGLGSDSENDARMGEARLPAHLAPAQAGSRPASPGSKNARGVSLMALSAIECSRFGQSLATRGLM